MSPSATSTVVDGPAVDLTPLSVPPGPTGLPEKAYSWLLDRNMAEPAVEVKFAKGNYFFTVDDRTILDGSGGASVSCLGHGDRRVLEAIITQMERCAYVNSAMFSTASTNDISEYVAKSAGFAKMFICCSGSEAMDGAMKLAIQYFNELGQPQRVNFIAREQSYHGNTFGALAMSGHKARRKLYEKHLDKDNIHRVSACYAYRQRKEAESDAEFVAKKAAELEEKILKLGPETVIGFVCEPISGATLGCVPYVPGYLAAMKAVCVKFDILFILDEVMCGMGRSGTLHAWQAEHSDELGYDCRPDIQTVGKGLGGGYQPVAGILIGRKIVTALTDGSGVFVSGHTYQAFPVACAAALEVQRIVDGDNLLQNVRKQGAYLSSLLHERLDSHPHVGDIRGMGLFWGIEIVKDKATKKPYDASRGIAKLIQKIALNNWDMAIYIGQGTADGVDGDHVIISPAYNVTPGIVELIVEKIAGAINDVPFDTFETGMKDTKLLGKALNVLKLKTDGDSSGLTTAVNTPSSNGEDWPSI